MKFKVLLTGRHIVIPNLDDPASDPIRGFVVWRCVEASNAEDASRLAVAAVDTDPKLRGAIVEPASGPIDLSVDEVHELESFATPPPPGYIFFHEDDEGP